MREGGNLTSVADYSLASSLQFLQEQNNHTHSLFGGRLATPTSLL